MDASHLLSLAAIACHLTAYVLYVWEMRRGDTSPNVVSWLIWTALTWLNLASYGFMTGDAVKVAAISVNAVGCTAILLCVLKKGRRQALDLPERLSLTAGVASIAAWMAWRSATVANLIVQVGELTGFVPTLLGLLRQRGGEHPAAWGAWSAGFACTLGVVITRWTGHWADLAYPLVSLTVHLTTFAICMRYWRRMS